MQIDDVGSPLGRQGLVDEVRERSRIGSEVPFNEVVVTDAIRLSQEATVRSRRVDRTHTDCQHRLVRTEEPLGVDGQSGRPIDEHGGRGIGPGQCIKRHPVGEPVRHRGQLVSELGVVQL